MLKKSLLLTLLTLTNLAADTTQPPLSFTTAELAKNLSDDCTKALSQAGYSSSCIKRVNDTVMQIPEKFKKYEVSGFSICLDPNFAFIYDNQNPSFNVKYKSAIGDVKVRKYQASINSWGLKFELALKLNIVFVIDTSSRFYDIRTPIDLDMGIDLGLLFGSGLSVTYVPFKRLSGALLIVGIPFGIPGGSISVVTSGTLTPLWDMLG